MLDALVVDLDADVSVQAHVEVHGLLALDTKVNADTDAGVKTALAGDFDLFNPASVKL